MPGRRSRSSGSRSSIPGRGMRLPRIPLLRCPPLQGRQLKRKSKQGKLAEANEVSRPVGLRRHACGRSPSTNNPVGSGVVRAGACQLSVIAGHACGADVRFGAGGRPFAAPPQLEGRANLGRLQRWSANLLGPASSGLPLGRLNHSPVPGHGHDPSVLHLMKHGADSAGASRVSTGGGRVPDRVPDRRRPPPIQGHLLQRADPHPVRGRRSCGARCPRHVIHGKVALRARTIRVIPGDPLRDCRPRGGVPFPTGCAGVPRVGLCCPRYIVHGQAVT
jgi:hypothetical protein